MGTSIYNCTKEKEEILEKFDKNFEKDLVLIEERNQAMAELVADLNTHQFARFEKFLLADEKVQRSVLRNLLATVLKKR